MCWHLALMRPFFSRFFFAFAALARFFITLSPFNFGQDAGFLNFLFEPFQGAFYGLTLVHFDFRQANQPSVLSVWLWGSTRVNSTTRRATPNVKSWRTPRQGTAVYQYTNYIYKAQQNRVFEAISGSCLLKL